MADLHAEAQEEARRKGASPSPAPDKPAPDEHSVAIDCGGSDGQLPTLGQSSSTGVPVGAYEAGRRSYSLRSSGAPKCLLTPDLKTPRPPPPPPPPPLLVGDTEEGGEGRDTTAGEMEAGVAKAGVGKTGVAKEGVGKEGESAEAAAVFLRLDEDGSGSLEWREVYVALEELGVDPNCPEVLKAVAGFDEDGSGSLEQAEFESFIAAVRAEESFP